MRPWKGPGHRRAFNDITKIFRAMQQSVIRQQYHIEIYCIGLTLR